MTADSLFTPFRIVLLFILVMLCGILALPKLNVDLLPADKSSQLHVYFSLPNSSPAVVEQQVNSILKEVYVS